jgi:hypothetical protein
MCVATTLHLQVTGYPYQTRAYVYNIMGLTFKTDLLQTNLQVDMGFCSALMAPLS